MLSEDEKLDILYKYQEMDELSKEQIKRVIGLTSDKSSIVRLEAAECLFQEYSVTTRVLMRLAKDRDELVRVSAYETLGLYTSEMVEEFLKNAMNKEHKELALAYAIRSWIDVVVERGEYLKQFENKRKVQKSDYCILVCLTGKYLFWEKSVLKEIIKKIYHPNSNVRCWALNDMEYIYNDDNKKEIILYMTKALNDPVRKVAASAEKFLKKQLIYS